MKRPLRIYIIDSPSFFLSGMCKHLESSCAGCKITVSSKYSISEIPKIVESDILISNLKTLKSNYFKFLLQLKRQNRSFPVLTISWLKKLSIIIQVKKLGVEGILFKEDEKHLLSGIKNILNGNKYYSPNVLNLLKEFKLNYPAITSREEEVISLMSSGYSNKQIANTLCIGQETVKSHKRNIRTKLGVSELHEIIHFAQIHSLI